MIKVSINVLTRNRSQLLKLCLDSVYAQSFKDVEVIVVNDGSTDETPKILQNYPNLKVIHHQQQVGITHSRDQALRASVGEYIAILDDDDEWTDINKLKKQVGFLDVHPDYMLVGGAIEVASDKRQVTRKRPTTDHRIRQTMLFRNNFFTSTVMFQRAAALRVGGFILDSDDFAEDYDLWLRLGNTGRIANFDQVFAKYRQPHYNKARFKAFLRKQLRLIDRECKNYPSAFFAKFIIKLRLIL